MENRALYPMPLAGLGLLSPDLAVQPSSPNDRYFEGEGALVLPKASDGSQSGW